MGALRVCLICLRAYTNKIIMKYCSIPRNESKENQTITCIDFNLDWN